jgi:hypothetical protein
MRPSPCSWFQYAPAPLLAAFLSATSAVASAQTESQVDVRVTGTILWNAFSTSGRTNNFDLPQFVLRPTFADSGRDGSGFGMTVRQTRLGVRAFWPEVGGAEVRAEIDADFYGGQQQSGFGDLFPLARVRRAVVDIRWDRGTLLIGQEVPLVAEYNPVSLATVGLSGLSSSGNLWLWLPQIRGGWRVARGARVRLDLEGAFAAMGGNEASGELFTQPDRVEQSDRPAVQARAIVRWGTADRPGEVSLGAHRAWLAGPADSLIASHAVVAAWRIPLGTHLSLTGEAFRGQALAGLGGGGVGQLLGPGDVPVRSRGAWAQGVFQLPRAVQLTFGGGFDDPTDADVGVGDSGRLRNGTILAGIHWNPGPVVTALEARRLTTTYRTGEYSATHLNLGIGISF